MAEVEIGSREIVSRLKAQDHGAFNQLVKHFHYPLTSHAAGIAGQALAEEIVQEAWISIYRALPGFEERASLKTWLYTIVRNECFNRLRKENRKPEQTHAVDAEQDPLDAWFSSSFAEDGHWNAALPEWGISTPEELLQEEQLQQCIQHTLTFLKPDQKAVFELRDRKSVV